MNTEIIEQPLVLDIYGFSGIAADKKYGALAFQLSGKMWDIVKALDIKNKGRNIWVYEDGHYVFAGVELMNTPPVSTPLERKTITLPRYGYYKHVGPYDLLKQAGANLQLGIKEKGHTSTLLYIEIYGHWVKDERKLETELLTALA